MCPFPREPSRFLSEALPLVSSYLSGEQVTLGGRDTDIGEDSDFESRIFASHLILRHALACCAELVPLVYRIETHVSTTNHTVRDETVGTLRGRLDIPRFVARRSTVISWPRRYPILVTEDIPLTPENALVIRVFRELLKRLSGVATRKTAESMSAQKYRHWILSRMRRVPWSDVTRVGTPTRLILETAHRIVRRQTGNEYAYGGLLNLIHDWNLFSNDFGGSVTSSNFLRSILAFPIDDFFGDRIFEIWCLREVGESLKRLGASMLEGPNPLSQNKQNPTFRFNYYGHLIEVWFQRGLDKLEAHWTYDHSGSPLRGIPDITIIGNSTNYLIFDAKNRMVSGSTRSEETYKILGYLQNFQSLLEGPSCWGGLAFTSTTCFHQSLHCRTGRKLFMISAHPTDHTECGFRAQIDSQLASWLDAWAN